MLTAWHVCRRHIHPSLESIHNNDDEDRIDALQMQQEDSNNAARGTLVVR